MKFLIADHRRSFILPEECEVLPLDEPGRTGPNPPTHRLVDWNLQEDVAIGTAEELDAWLDKQGVGRIE